MACPCPKGGGFHKNTTMGTKKKIAHGPNSSSIILIET